VLNQRDGAETLIGNLPADGCVEVACTADARGARPIRYGSLPPQMAAPCDWNMRMFDLAARAAMLKSKEAAIHALMLDPLCAAVLSPAEIRDMTLEMFDAERHYLPGYK
jgi:alpha-galactosidase